MKQAAARSGFLQSVVFDMTADIAGTIRKETGMTGKGRLTVHGITQDAGRMTQAGIVFSGSLGGPSAHSAELDMEMISEKDGGTYFFLRTLNVTPQHPLLPTDAFRTFLGQWWNMASPAAGISPVTVSPDPGLLLAQSQVIRIVKDNGIRRIRGRRAYVYDVTVDAGKLMAYLKKQAEQQGKEFDEAAAVRDFSRYSAAGQLWVDADSFHVQRVTWDIRGNENGSETLRADVIVDFSAHDAAPAIAPPAAAKAFGSQDFLRMPSGTSALLPTPGPFVPSEEDPTLLEMFRTPAPSTTP